jgi:hypothetical protein
LLGNAHGLMSVRPMNFRENVPLGHQVLSYEVLYCTGAPLRSTCVWSSVVSWPASLSQTRPRGPRQPPRCNPYQVSASIPSVPANYLEWI